MTEKVNLTGRLIRPEGNFILACEDGRKLRLILPRMPVDLVEKMVVVTGTVRDDLVEVEGVAAF